MPFHRAMCGVDGSPEAVEAGRQAARLMAPDGAMALVAVVDPWGAILDLRGRAPADVVARSRQEAEAHLDGVAGEIPGGMRLDKRVLEGQPGPALIEEALRQGADLLAVGSHGRSRRAGVLLGSVATRAAHESPCPVLITRSAGAGAFPTAVVVGVDGSDEAWQAWDIASCIAAHHGVAARAVVVSGSAGTTVAAVQKRIPGAERLDGRAAHVLAEIAAPGELLVVGARGMGGLLSLGSVAERVAHHARASVLVVRSAPVPPVADTAGSVADG